jgi:Protein of unknown function (DUF3592)
MGRARDSFMTGLQPWPMKVLVGLVLTGIGVGLVYGGLHERAASTPVKHGITTTGEVTDFTEVDGGHDSTGYDLEISFTDRAGQTYRFTTPTVSHLPELGTKVKVSYDPNNPQHASDLSLGNAQWLFFLGLGLAALLFEFYLAVNLVLWRREHETSPFPT